MLRYTMMFQPEPEGGYTVTCPALQGLVTYGETMTEAITMAEDALQCYLEGLQQEQVPFPPDVAAFSIPVVTPHALSA